MSRKKITVLTEEPDHDLLEHIRDLGLKSVEEYRDWCARNGFGRKLKKHWKQRCRERFHSRQTIAQERLNQKKREKRNLIEVLTGICEGRLCETDVTQTHLKRLCQILRSDRGVRDEPQISRKALLRLLTHLHHCRAKFFDGSIVIAELAEQPGNTFVEALALIAAHYRSWLRPIENWKPRSHSVRRQFASLLRHLFVQYNDMPLFFDSVWFDAHTKMAADRRKWYLHVGRGQNIRHCKLPITFTKKMAYHFMRAPDNLSFEQALRWGQVHGLGGNERLAQSIMGTRLIQNFDNDEFWVTVIRWFASHPMLDRAHVSPVIDYLHNQRFVSAHVFVAPGQREETPPPQPNMAMKGRSPESILRQVNKWHHSLERNNTHQVSQWASSGIEEFEYLEGSQKNGSLKCWTIRELLSSKSLVAEGRQLKHCVATYAPSCANGYTSIWTMELESFEGHRKVVTIEIRNNVRLICQIRGKANRLPSDKEKNIINRWATKVGLKMASYL